jgi:hypothetical protein
VGSSVFAVLCMDMEPAVTLLDSDGAPPAVCIPAAKPRRRGHRARPPAGDRPGRGRAGIAVEHVARGVVYMATPPLEANVQFMTVMATKMPFVGRG